MARYRRQDQIEEPVAEGLEADGVRWNVDLIAKRATGVRGYRMTLSFLEVDGEGSAFVELDPAPSREAAAERAWELRAAPARIRALLIAQRGG